MKLTTRSLGPVAAAILLAGLPGLSHAVPSFARQTGLSCESCHTQFPELTAMGRNFKMSGYTFGVKKIESDSGDKAGVEAFSAPQLPPISAMIQASYSALRNQPDPSATDAGAAADKRGMAALPQQASIFLAGEIAPNLGVFVQMTYDSTFHFDNTDMRYARDLSIGGKDLTLGLDMNNNPTVQDIWNSSPAWGFPYSAPGVSSFDSPTPMISSLGGAVMGLGGYAYFDELLYAEVSGYRSSSAGAPEGAGQSAITGTAPYWRLALVSDKNDVLYMVGAYGMGLDEMASTALPAADSSHFDDVAVDAEYQVVGDSNAITFMANFTRERSYIPADPTTLQANLDVLKVTGSYLYSRAIGASLGLQNTRVDDGLSGLLDSRNLIYEIDYLPALNTKFSLQYTQYLSANGIDQGSNYAVDANGINGRNPEDNNVLSTQMWLVF